MAQKLSNYPRSSIVSIPHLPSGRGWPGFSSTPCLEGTLDPMDPRPLCKATERESAKSPRSTRPRSPPNMACWLSTCWLEKEWSFFFKQTWSWHDSSESYFLGYITLYVIDVSIWIIVNVHICSSCSLCALSFKLCQLMLLFCYSKFFVTYILNCLFTYSIWFL